MDADGMLMNVIGSLAVFKGPAILNATTSTICTSLLCKFLDQFLETRSTHITHNLVLDLTFAENDSCGKAHDVFLEEIGLAT